MNEDDNNNKLFNTGVNLVVARQQNATPLAFAALGQSNARGVAFGFLGATKCPPTATPLAFGGPNATNRERGSHSAGLQPPNATLLALSCTKVSKCRRGYTWLPCNHQVRPPRVWLLGGHQMRRGSHPVVLQRPNATPLAFGCAN